MTCWKQISSFSAAFKEHHQLLMRSTINRHGWIKSFFKSYSKTHTHTRAHTHTHTDVSSSFPNWETARLRWFNPNSGPCEEFFKPFTQPGSTIPCWSEACCIVHVTPQGWQSLAWLWFHSSNHLSLTDQKNLEGCCKQDWRDWAPHGDSPLEGMPTGCSLLCCITHLETAKIVAYQILHTHIHTS